MNERAVGKTVAQNQKTTKLPAYLETLLEGNGVGIREKLPYPFEKPHWLDEAKVRRGQKFAMDHLFGILFSTGMSVILVTAYQSVLKPLIFTRNSSTPFTAFKRYLKTILYIRSWYQYDLLQPSSAGHQNLKIVRGLHENVKKQLEAEPPEQLEKKLTNEGGPMHTDLHEELLEDFKAFPELQVPICGEKIVHVSQTDMVVAQFAFMGLISSFPKLFGIYNASNEDIDDFLHLWRYLGHLLGIEDKYNLCAGDLKTVLQRNRDLMELWLKPSLKTASRDWLHMSRCMIEGISYFAPGTDFQVQMLYLCRNVLNIPVTNQKARLGFKQIFLYCYSLFMMNFLIRIPGVFKLLNGMCNKGIDEASKIPKSEIQRLQAIVHPYEMSHRSSCPMMG